jgi:flagellar hook-associated protein 3 FlgL
MRISTNMLFDAGVASMNQQLSDVVHLQQQVASGRRILTPADDPVAAARVLEVQQAADVTAQFRVNQDNARAPLELEETQLDSATEVLQRAKELAIAASNGTLTFAQRQGAATELRARYDQLMGIANSTDGTGQYMFAGYQSATRPFSGTIDALIAGGEASYAGDDGPRRLQVSATRFIEVADPGSDVFMGIDNGAGGSQSIFKTIADLVGAIEDPSNTGAAFSADITAALGNINRGLDSVLSVRGAIGSRLNELDSLSTSADDMAVQYAQTLSNLQDLDYAQAVSDLTRKQAGLQAAQKSFSTTSQLSLFNYL